MKRSPGTLMGIFSIVPLIFLMVSMGTMVAPICWVIAPSSVLTTDDPRIRSRSEVLPWSTWPSTATIGVRIPDFCVTETTFCLTINRGENGTG